MFYVIYPELWQFSLKMEILEFTSKEAAAPLMSLAAPLRFWKFWKKILDFGIFLKILKIMSYNFQSRKQILTLRGVYWLENFDQKLGLQKTPPPWLGQKPSTF